MIPQRFSFTWECECGQTGQGFECEIPPTVKCPKCKVLVRTNPCVHSGPPMGNSLDGGIVHY